MRKLMCSCIVVLLLAVVIVNAAPIAVSNFNTGNEGWRLVSTLGHNSPASWSASGGNPGGFIYGQDPDVGAFGFAAPSKFLGNVSAAYGQTLNFDVAAYQTPDSSTSWVGISGAGYEFVSTYSTPTSIYPAWHSRSVTLHENVGWVDPDTQIEATHQQMLAVLADLDGLVIATEFVEGLETDVSGLDNVSIVPEPATILLFGLGGLLLRGRKNA